MKLIPNVLHIWNYWCELTRGRGSGMGGPEPIDYQKIGWWMMTTGASPSPTEIALVIEFDTIWRVEWHELQKTKNPSR